MEEARSYLSVGKIHIAYLKKMCYSDYTMCNDGDDVFVTMLCAVITLAAYLQRKK